MPTRTRPRPGLDTELALRQQLLLLRSAELRAALATQWAPWQQRLGWLARAARVVAGWKARPEWPWALLAAVIMWRRPQPSVRWGLRLWGAWRLWQQVSPWSSAQDKRRPPGAADHPQSAPSISDAWTRRPRP